ESVDPEFFTFDNKELYATSNLGRDKAAIVRLDPDTGKELEVLFEHPEARQWVERVSVDPRVLENFRSAPGTLISEVGSRQVLTTITEALMAQESPHGAEDFQRAVKRQIGRAWARFSQHVKKALGVAEASQDAELQAKLMQEYIDVQRKIKEFTSFYDEAE
ncbi:hypothetical protein EBZ37_10285, partial [bacterium]|nr:hypothetical protein [bacterium]